MLACIAGDEAAALDLINGIRFESTPRKTEKWPTRTTIASVYARDHYLCRYCGEQFSHHPNWKADATHPWIRVRPATLDHIL
jgi:5-methylcytosine-specific restriction endonuclease McrA